MVVLLFFFIGHSKYLDIIVYHAEAAMNSNFCSQCVLLLEAGRYGARYDVIVIQKGNTAAIGIQYYKGNAEGLKVDLLQHYN